MLREYSRTWSLGWRSGYYALKQQYKFIDAIEFAAYEEGRAAGREARAKMDSEFGDSYTGLIERWVTGVRIHKTPRRKKLSA